MNRGLTAVFLLAVSLPAHARYYDFYRADYVKGAFCSVIGGACASDPDFDNSFFQNPASLTAGGSNWDYDYDTFLGNNLEPGMKGNNTVSQSTFMAAVAYSEDRWGMGISYTQTTAKVGALAGFFDDANGAPVNFNANTTARTTQINLPISFRITRHYHVGVTFTGFWQTTNVSVDQSISSSKSAQPLPALGAAIGGIWEMSPEFRTGGWIRSPLTYYTSETINARSDVTRFVYQEDMAINYPWLWAIGSSWMPWRDRRTFLFDLNFVGTTDQGYLMTYDNFANASTNSHQIEKGRHLIVDPRAGMRVPWWRHSNGTLSLGSYYENSRWQGYPGLLHATGGLAYKLPVKVGIIDGIEFMVGIDVAKNYQMVFFTYR